MSQSPISLLQKMALNSFQGIPFTNPGYLCYCNASVNGILASEIISSNMIQSDCAICSFLLSMRSNASHGHNQSSLLLKEHLASVHTVFNSKRQQDPSEFIFCLLKKCDIISGLTKSEIISSYKCGNSNCSHLSDDSDSDERFKNIIHLNITGFSVNEIILNAITNNELEWKRCQWCNKLCNHMKKQNWMILPSVLIICLQRFNASRFTEVDPSVTIDVNGVKYVLRAVITHHGKYVSRGHITATIYTQEGNWIKCDDTALSMPTNDVPKDGFVFIYDQLTPAVSNPFNEIPLLSQNYDSTSQDNQQPKNKDSLSVSFDYS